MQKEKDRLKGTDPFLIIDYIRSTIEIIMNLKAEAVVGTNHESKDNSMQANPRDYEQMAQKLEEEVRNHIRVHASLGRAATQNTD